MYLRSLQYHCTFFLLFCCVTFLTPIAMAEIPNKHSLEFGDVVSQINLPTTNASGLAWDGEYFWVLDLNWIYKIDPASGTSVLSYMLDISSPEDLTFDGEYLWVSCSFEKKIYQIFPPTGTILHSFDVYHEIVPAGLAWEGSSDLLVGDTARPWIERLDSFQGAQQGGVGAPPSLGDDNPSSLEWDGEYIWAGYRGDGVIYQINPENEPFAEIVNVIASPSGELQRGVAWDGEYLWSTGGDNTLYKIYVGDPPPITGCIEINGVPYSNKRIHMTQWKQRLKVATTDHRGCYSFDHVVPGLRFKITFSSPPISE